PARALRGNERASLLQRVEAEDRAAQAQDVQLAVRAFHEGDDRTGADAAAELDLLPRLAAVDFPRQHDAETEVAVHIGALQFGDRAAAVDETTGDRAGPVTVVEFEQRRHVVRRLLPRDGEGALHAGPPVVL